MNRALELTAIGCLACALILAHPASPTRATLPPRSATPGATPLAAGACEIPGAAPVSLTIQSMGAADRLLGGASPVADRIEVHGTRLIDGKRIMDLAPEGIVILGGKSLVLEPGRSHLMLLGLTVDLVQGDTFPLTLRFARAGEVTVMARVRRRVDAAGVPAIPPVVVGDLQISHASAPPAPANRSSRHDDNGDSCRSMEMASAFVEAAHRAETLRPARSGMIPLARSRQSPQH